jgi:two-component system LytT family response regulator/two-component system response regulator LytT
MPNSSLSGAANTAENAPASGGVAISAILVDDEKLASDELAYLLKEFPEIEILATASNGLEAVKMIEDLEPDLVFMDVQMPGLDGMGVIRKLKEKGVPLPHFVMATAYDQYAVEAFRLEALDYLLKPVEKDRLAISVERARRLIGEKVAERAAAEKASNSKSQSEQASKPSLQRMKLLIKSNHRNLIVDASDVVYATIDDGLITVVATTVEGQSNYRTIEELQSNLDPDMFWRVHRSFLVNVNRIKEVIPWFKSSFQLKMDDKKQTEIPVSRVQTKRLRALLKL